MQINLIRNSLSETIQSQIGSSLKISDKNNIRIFPNIEFCFSEQIKGIQKLFPHKKKAICILGGNPIINECLEYLSGEAFDLEIFKWKDVKESKSELLSKMSSEFSFIFFSEDCSLTGEKFPTDDIKESAEKNRLYSFSCFNVLEHFLAMKKDKLVFCNYSVSANADFAFSILGSRSKRLQSLAFSNYKLQTEQYDDISSEIESWEISDESTDSSNFEIDGLKLMQENEDRVVYLSTEIDPFAIVEQANEIDASFSECFKSSSLCEWGGIRSMDWLLNQFDEDSFNKLLIISKEDFCDSKKLVEEAIVKIKETYL